MLSCEDQSPAVVSGHASDESDPATPAGPVQDAAGLESGRWSSAEHARFVDGLEKFGRRKWIRIAEHVGTRTVIQVRSHAQKYFKKLRRTSAPRPAPPPPPHQPEPRAPSLRHVDARSQLALLTEAARLLDASEPAAPAAPAPEAAEPARPRDACAPRGKRSRVSDDDASDGASSSLSGGRWSRDASPDSDPQGARPACPVSPSVSISRDRSPPCVPRGLPDGRLAAAPPPPALELPAVVSFDDLAEAPAPAAKRAKLHPGPPVPPVALRSSPDGAPDVATVTPSAGAAPQAPPPPGPPLALAPAA